MNIRSLIPSFLLSLLFLISFSGVAHAQESTATLPANGNKVEGSESVDDMITNNNLRAMSGSLSKWSIASSFTYDGGTLSQPFAESRPNIAGASATSTDTDLTGQLSVKYNVSPQSSLLLGIGIRKMAPFVSSGPSAAFYAEGGKDIDAFDPTLTFQRVYKWGVVQAVLQATYTQYTRQDIVAGNGGNLSKAVNLDQENIIEIGSTGLSIGGSVGIGGSLPTDYTQDYSRYQYWLDPYVEYQLTEKINLRTVCNLWNYEIYPTAGLIHDNVTESVGVGFSINRDIFLYPNVQFLPDHASTGVTNVGVTATVNLF